MTLGEISLVHSAILLFDRVAVVSSKSLHCDLGGVMIAQISFAVARLTIKVGNASMASLSWQ